MKRTVIIGDVHGCREELEDLLEAVSVDETDSIVFTGDLVARGPDSLGVLELARRLNALSVIGNHERRLLEIRDTERGGEHLKLPAAYRHLVKELRHEDWAYLSAMPYYVELPQHGAAIVHAGVKPGLVLERQDPWVLTHIRSLDDKNKPSSKLGERSWAESYVGPPHIVFGHSAQRGIQVHEYATGLDSGCVYGKRLTALVLQNDEPVPPRSLRESALISVPARGVHFVPHSSS
jgi:hypothetical protein